MAYVKNIWVDQDVERPKTYEVTNNQDGSITLTDSFGVVTELGTPVNADNMNHIEDGIAQCYVDLADSDLSNLTETGEKHFLNKQQVTNCLLEVPNNIKLELENGVLTLKAGSKVIVPNGFEQDGVTPKFDEITIENDVVRSYTSSSASTGFVYFDINGQTNLPYTAYSCSGSKDTITGTHHLWYDTTNNLLKIVTSSNVVSGNTAFPVGRITLAGDGTASVSNINQVFNGFGYIGSVIWADKGIKGLIPNGRNADGSLNNTEFTTSGVLTIDVSVAPNGLFNCGLNANSITRRTPHYCAYYPESNFVIDNGTVIDETVFGNFKVVSGVITVASFVNALNINSMCDGQWVDANVTLASGVTAPTTTNIEYDLSNYLPNDGYDYEVIVNATAMTTSTSGSSCRVYVTSSLIQSNCFITRAQTRTSSTMSTEGAIIFPIGTDRKLILKSYSNNSGTINLYVRGYRRLGTNV
jgi:hypothetical protein